MGDNGPKYGVSQKDMDQRIKTTDMVGKWVSKVAGARLGLNKYESDH